MAKLLKKPKGASRATNKVKVTRWKKRRRRWKSGGHENYYQTKGDSLELGEY